MYLQKNRENNRKNNLILTHVCNSINKINNNNIKVLLIFTFMYKYLDNIHASEITLKLYSNYYFCIFLKLCFIFNQSFI